MSEECLNLACDLREGNEVISQPQPPSLANRSFRLFLFVQTLSLPRFVVLAFAVQGYLAHEKQPHPLGPP